ncbi:MAG: hypothetical protein V4633_24675 [Pseudomonadota bacterium]
MSESARFFAVNPEISLAALHDRMVVFAQDELGKLIHVDSARRGKACRCRCLACDETLIARHGDFKAHSFAHASGTECQYAIDAVLNRLAQELIGERGVFTTPPLTVTASLNGPFGPIRREENISSRTLRVEAAGIDRRVHPRRPSVVMQVKGRELLLEVTYAHHLDAHKRAAIEKFGLPAIEMHIPEGKLETVEQFERLLVQDARFKHWIFNPKAAAIQIRLEHEAAAQLAEENARHVCLLERRRRDQEVLEAANLLRENEARAALEHQFQMQAERDHLMREAQALARSLAQPVSKDAIKGHASTFHYRLPDGGLLIRHEPGGCVFIVPDTGSESVLGILVERGLEFNVERDAYQTTEAELQEVYLPLVRPHQLGVKSV